MNSAIIAEAARATLDGSLPFPEVVRKLIETGVEYYHVDYVAPAEMLLQRRGRCRDDAHLLRGLAIRGGRLRCGRAARGHSRQPAPRPALPRLHPACDGGRRAGLHRLPARTAGDLLGARWRSAHRMVSGGQPELSDTGFARQRAALDELPMIRNESDEEVDEWNLAC